MVVSSNTAMVIITCTFIVCCFSTVAWYVYRTTKK